MATTQSGTGQVQATKTVTLVGYLAEAEEMGERRWADEYDDNHNYFEQETEEMSTHYMVIDGERERIDRDKFLKLAQMDTGEIEIDKETTSHTSYVQTPKRAAGKLRREVLDEAEKAFPDWAVRNTSIGTDIRTLSRDGLISTYRYVDTKRMLKHQSEMGEGDIYEDDDTEYTVFKLKLKFEQMNPKLMEKVSKEVVEPIITALGQHEEVNQVRFTDCEQKQVEKGACLNI